MVFQNPALYPHLTVFENLAFGLRARGVPWNQAMSKVNTMAGLLGLDGLLGRRPGALSGGERQRVAIGRALARHPRVLLFDEPFSSLDPPLRAALREEVVDLHRQFGTTLILVTHDQADALLMGDRIAILDRGRLLQCDSPRAIYQQPAHRFVATFVGSPPDEHPALRGRARGGRIRIHPIAAEHALSWTLPGDSLPAGIGQVELGLRPEAIRVKEAGSLCRSLDIIADAPGPDPAIGVQRRRTPGDPDPRAAPTGRAATGQPVHP